MLTIALFVLFGFAISAAKRAIRFRPASKTSNAGSNPVTATLTVLNRLQEQRDIIEDLLSDIEYRLDAAPPEKTREKLLKDKARLCGQLAGVNAKINKLIR